MCEDAKGILIVSYTNKGLWTAKDGTYFEKDGTPVNWMSYLEDERCGAATLLIQYGSLATMGALIATLFSF